MMRRTNKCENRMTTAPEMTDESHIMQRSAEKIDDFGSWYD
jgi:hypothetical protein